MQGIYLHTQALIDAFSKNPQTILSVSKVAPEEVSKYGILKPGARGDDGVIAVDGLVEKPERDVAPSTMASFGRYVSVSCHPPSVCHCDGFIGSC
jgi:UTP--glucose-1-phosphate uridylyltransferase